MEWYGNIVSYGYSAGFDLHSQSGNDSVNIVLANGALIAQPFEPKSLSPLKVIRDIPDDFLQIARGIAQLTKTPLGAPIVEKAHEILNGIPFAGNIRQQLHKVQEELPR